MRNRDKVIARSANYYLRNTNRVLERMARKEPRRVPLDASWGRHSGIGYCDPGFDVVEHTEDFRSLAKQAPVIPADWVRRCREGELTLLVDADGARFVSTRQTRVNAVPWQDFAGPMPSMAIMSAGRMAHAHSKRRHHEQVGWQRGHGAKKSKAAA